MQLQLAVLRFFWVLPKHRKRIVLHVLKLQSLYLVHKEVKSQLAGSNGFSGLGLRLGLGLGLGLRLRLGLGVLAATFLYPTNELVLPVTWPTFLYFTYFKLKVVQDGSVSILTRTCNYINTSSLLNVIV